MLPFLSTSPFLIIGIVILILSIIGITSYYFSSKQTILRILAKTPYKPVSSFKSNEFVKVSGKALHVQNPLIAPLSKRKCIFYYIKIEQKKSNGKNSYWRTLIEEERFQDFFIESNGNMVIIKPTQHPKNYKSHLVIDKKTSSGTFNNPTPEFESLLKRYNIDSTGYFGFNKTLRYKEGIIEIGETITVAGIVKWKNLSEPIPEYNYSKIATLESDVKQKIIITDLPETINFKRH
ncbi:GIDE domain-containing protein [Gaetbulibacter sp. NE]|uniref:GIDE domain-containing protein n=1 Tax=Gaetbulibacter sp. NE TaxID=2982307 RepID=UPI0021CE8638|nr:GIDE domain-containing protein [Gaetbulibacter sp. NE]